MTNTISFTAGVSLSDYLANSPSIPDMKSRILHKGRNPWPSEIAPEEAVDHLVERYLHMIRNAFPWMHSETWLQVLDLYNSRTEVSTRALATTSPATELMEMNGVGPDEFARLKQQYGAKTHTILRAIDELAGLTVAETMAMMYAVEHWWGRRDQEGDIRKFLARLFYRPESLVFRNDCENYDEALCTLWEFAEIPGESHAEDPTRTYYKCTHKDYEGLEFTLLCVRDEEQEQIELVEGPGESALTHTHYMMGADLINEIFLAWYQKTPVQANAMN